MKIQLIEEPNKPAIKKIEFICDGGIHPKLEKGEFTRIGLNKHSFTYIVGRPQSGKSNLVQNFFKCKELLRKCFHNVFYISPSSSSLKDDVFNVLDDSKRFTDLNAESLEAILNKCESTEKTEKNMIVIDDCAASLKNHDLEKMFSRLVLNRRHTGGGVSIIIISQSYNLLPLTLRKMLDNLILFKPTFDEFELINEELLRINRKELKKVYKFFFDEKYKFLMYNVEHGKYFKNFDKVEFDDE